MIIGQVLDKFLPITESWIYSQIKSLDRLNVQSKIFCHKIVNTDVFHHQPIYSYHGLSRIKKRYFKKKAAMQKKDSATLFWSEILKKEKLDIIHSHFGWAAKKGIDLALENNIPHLATFYGADVTRDPFGKSESQKEYQKKLSLIFKNSCTILCISNFLRKRLIELGAPQEKVQVWRLGIDLNLFKKQKKYKKKSKDFKIISVGRFKEWKGQKYLIQALPKILKHRSNIKLTFIGTGSALGDCRQLAKKLGVENYIDFKEKLPEYLDVVREMAASDLIAHSSYTAEDGTNDSLAMVLIEAGAVGVPAVASNSGGIPEALSDKKTGFLVEQKNSDDLAEKIITLMKNEALRKEMGRKAENFVSKEYNLSQQIDKLKNIYEAVI